MDLDAEDIQIRLVFSVEIELNERSELLCTCKFP